MDDANKVEPVASGPIIEPDETGIARAAGLLCKGELIAFPTETVYGLGANALSDRAVGAVFRAKGRPANNPLIVHVADRRMAGRFGVFNEVATRLAKRFWPGPLTLVLKRREKTGLSSHITAGLETIALRVPSHPVALSLIAAFDGPIAAPSANISGRLSPTEPEHVEDMLGDKVALILDGGPCAQGLESTILGFADGQVVLLRPGAIARETLEDFLQQALVAPTDQGERVLKPEAPGRLASHYAPHARLRLNALKGHDGELMLAFGPDAPKNVPGVNLSPAGDLAEAAANLYAYLHLLDDTGVATIAVMPIPHEGLGAVINDRLARAAAPRPSEGNSDDK